MVAFGMVFMSLVFFALIVAGALLVARSFSHNAQSPQVSDSRALDLLNERFARGEIDQSEFEERILLVSLLQNAYLGVLLDHDGSLYDRVIRSDWWYRYEALKDAPDIQPREIEWAPRQFPKPTDLTKPTIDDAMTIGDIRDEFGLLGAQGQASKEIVKWFERSFREDYVPDSVTIRASLTTYVPHMTKLEEGLVVTSHAKPEVEVPLATYRLAKAMGNVLNMALLIYLGHPNYALLRALDGPIASTYVDVMRGGPEDVTRAEERSVAAHTLQTP
jgi:hypothetical protein